MHVSQNNMICPIITPTLHSSDTQPVHKNKTCLSCLGLVYDYISDNNVASTRTIIIYLCSMYLVNDQCLRILFLS